MIDGTGVGFQNQDTMTISRQTSAMTLPLCFCVVAAGAMALGTRPSIASATGVAMHADEKPAAEDDPFARWESSIQKMEEADKARPQPRNGILFVGSSSIRLWDLRTSFPEFPAINHGFGGSEIADSIHFADRIIVPFAPKVVVFYAGDNDVAKGKTAAVVVRDYKMFSDLLRTKLPETHVVFVAIKPSVKRWALSDEMKTANDAIAALCENDELRSYLDIWHPMLGDDGTPRPELFVQDGLHLNAEGYVLWNEILRKRLGELGFPESAN